MALEPVASGLPQASVPSPDPTSWVVQPGDTLCSIARRLQQEGIPGTTAELVRTLTRLNGLSNPDRIEVGQVLTLPPRIDGPRADEDLVSVLAQSGRSGAGTLRMSVDDPRTRLENAMLRWVHRVPSDARPSSAAGATPRFRQGDPAWRA